MYHTQIFCVKAVTFCKKTNSYKKLSQLSLCRSTAYFRVLPTSGIRSRWSSRMLQICCGAEKQDVLAMYIFMGSRIPGGGQSDIRVVGDAKSCSICSGNVGTWCQWCDNAITRTRECCLRRVRLDPRWNIAERGEARLGSWSARHQCRGRAAVHGARLLDQPEQLQCALLMSSSWKWFLSLNNTILSY